ncbi:hypothetical protein ACI1US_00736 [Leucobacter sp. BZR 635]
MEWLSVMLLTLLLPGTLDLVVWGAGDTKTHIVSIGVSERRWRVAAAARKNASLEGEIARRAEAVERDAKHREAEPSRT